MKTADRLLTISEVAERLQIKIPFLRKLIFQRRIPVSRIGRVIRFKPSEIERWLSERSTPERDR
jgi:excisionase family DNA binding protein